MSELRFEFGKNWNHFIRDLRESDVEIARMGLQKSLTLDRLHAKTFVDVGCGSGLMSLAALELAADRVVSFDYDSQSVEATRQLRQRCSQYAKVWEIYRGSILDGDFVERLGQFDIVYSWGVLHHTGNMWLALENTLRLLKTGGYLCIAVYNKTRTSRFWYHFKKIYCRCPEPFQTLLVMLIFLPRLIVRTLRGKFSLRDERGMHLWYDARDWAGGFPYEYASCDEIVNFGKARQLQLIHLYTTKRNGCNEFTFSPYVSG